jgi:hypothetical protein
VFCHQSPGSGLDPDPDSMNLDPHLCAWLTNGLAWFGRVAVVNQLARQLLHVEHPNSEEIVSRQNQLNSKWSLLREKSELKREELISAHGVQVSIQSSLIRFQQHLSGFGSM